MNLLIQKGALGQEGELTLFRLPRMTDAEFYEFCRQNETLNVERNAEGDIILMPPSDAWAESRGGDLFGDLLVWNRASGEPGYTFGSAAGFKFPGAGEKAPDAAWMSKPRWDAVPPADRHPFPPVAPEFVAEVMSPSDSLAASCRKMEQYMAAGVLLGWLIDRARRRVYVYRPGRDVEEHEDPATLGGAPELPGFTADLTRVFRKDPGE
jgi:Uma2 family endonuclease